MCLSFLSKPYDTASRVNTIRSHFPFFSDSGHPVYFDSAATSLKPAVVIDRITRYYSTQSSNVHRADYALGLEISQEYESCRELVRQFLDAGDEYEVIFNSGTTDGLNTVAQTLLKGLSHKATVHTSIMAHHSLLLPLRRYSQEYGLQCLVHSCDHSGALDIDALCNQLKAGDALFLCGMSNITGYTPPLKRIVEHCQEIKVPIIIDGAQLVSHRDVSLRDTPVDAIVFSPHKLFGPTGVGVLCIKRRLIDTLHPFRVGGGIVSEVTLYGQEYQEGARAFEAGTPAIASVLGMGAALTFIDRFGGMKVVTAHEKTLRKQLIDGLQAIPHIHILGDPDLSDVAVVSIVSSKYHAQDICFHLNANNIATRGGFLCAQPYVNCFTEKPAVRVSCHVYNTPDDILLLLSALEAL